MGAHRPDRRRRVPPGCAERGADREEHRDPVGPPAHRAAGERLARDRRREPALDLAQVAGGGAQERRDTRRVALVGERELVENERVGARDPPAEHVCREPASPPHAEGENGVAVCARAIAHPLPFPVERGAFEGERPARLEQLEGPAHPAPVTLVERRDREPLVR
jgi:hypothetical protein